MGGDSEGSSSYYGPGVVCCSLNTFKCTNFCWGLVCLANFIVGMVGLFTDDGFLRLLDENIYIGMTIFGGFAFFVVILGTLGAWAKVEIFFICYIFLMGLILLAQALGFVFLMLYVNDVGTVDDIDNAANDAQVGFLEQMIEFAEQEPDKWINFQNQIECCGITFDNVNEEINFETGALCGENGGNATLAGLAGFREFFCFEDLVAQLADFVIFIGIAIGFLLFVQFSAIVAACRLYWVPVWRGGWMFDEEDLEYMAEEKKIPLPPKLPPTQQSTAFQRMRNAGNRISFRVHNAMTANPNVPQTAGFLQRLSYNQSYSMKNSFKGRGFGGQQSGGFGAPGPAPSSTFKVNAPPGAGFGGPPAGPRWKRLSAGFQSFGNRMKNTFKPTPPLSAPKKYAPPSGYAGAPPAGVPRQKSRDDYSSAPKVYSGNRGTNLSAPPPAPPTFSTDPPSGRSNGFGGPAPPSYGAGPSSARSNGFGGPSPPAYGTGPPSGRSNGFGGPSPPSYGAGPSSARNNGFGDPSPPAFGTGPPSGRSNGFGGPSPPSYGGGPSSARSNGYGGPSPPSYGNNRGNKGTGFGNARGTGYSNNGAGGPRYGSAQTGNNAFGNSNRTGFGGGSNYQNGSSYGSAPPNVGFNTNNSANNNPSRKKKKRRKNSNNRKRGQQALSPLAASAQPGNLLAQIRQGTGLKPTYSNHV